MEGLIFGILRYIHNHCKHVFIIKQRQNHHLPPFPSFLCLSLQGANYLHLNYYNYD